MGVRMWEQEGTRPSPPPAPFDGQNSMSFDFFFKENWYFLEHIVRYAPLPVNFALPFKMFTDVHALKKSKFIEIWFFKDKSSWRFGPSRREQAETCDWTPNSSIWISSYFGEGQCIIRPNQFKYLQPTDIYSGQYFLSKTFHNCDLLYLN